MLLEAAAKPIDSWVVNRYGFVLVFLMHIVALDIKASFRLQVTSL